VAKEQEMQALTKENQAAVVMSEAEIPKALSDAYRMGTLRASSDHNGKPHDVGPLALPAPTVER
ncbi:MAG TPA: flotillin-like FloA family protein, partial [Planctomycetaceae bacterium]|nr:flotillin-like FloA family protein [Planctomycetaceae bacterium]